MDDLILRVRPSKIMKWGRIVGLTSGEADGFPEEVTAVALLALLTVSVKVGEVLLLKLVSPP